jgi:hypothetical protein
MATESRSDPSRAKWEFVPFNFKRSGLILSWFVYARIVARKRGIPPPEPDFDSLSDEEIDSSVQMLRDFVHPPPA